MRRKPDIVEADTSQVIGCLLGVAAIGAGLFVSFIKLVVEPWLISLF